MALPANQLAGRIPDSYIHMWAASLLRGEQTSLKYWYVQCSFMLKCKRGDSLMYREL